MVVPRHLFLLHFQSVPAACQGGSKPFPSVSESGKASPWSWGEGLSLRNLMMCIELHNFKSIFSKDTVPFHPRFKNLELLSFSCCCSSCLSDSAQLCSHGRLMDSHWFEVTITSTISLFQQWLYNLIRLHYCCCRANPSIGMPPDHHPHHEGPSFQQSASNEMCI